MLRITVQTNAKDVRIKLEGQLRGPWVAELENAWAAIQNTTNVSAIEIDLEGVSYVDERGSQLLRRMQEERATLQRASGFVQYILEHGGILGGFE